MTEQNTVQELKAERVQEEMQLVDVADDPFWVSLKAERVQEPELFAGARGGQLSSTFELTLSQKQPVTIELMALGVTITLHGKQTENNAAGQTPVQD
ncbi:MAG TPA: hypothetical protein VEW48_24270 [Thermoanaerobaculia bacterium]|nr:hypothetical protein [Thermoanaerobaculia bacterium]